MPNKVIFLGSSDKEKLINFLINIDNKNEGAGTNNPLLLTETKTDEMGQEVEILQIIEREQNKELLEKFSQFLLDYDLLDREKIGHSIKKGRKEKRTRLVNETSSRLSINRPISLSKNNHDLVNFSKKSAPSGISTNAQDFMSAGNHQTNEFTL